MTEIKPPIVPVPKPEQRRALPITADRNRLSPVMTNFLAQIVAINMPRPPGPDRLLPTHTESTAKALAGVMKKAGSEVMPKITAMNEQQLQRFLDFDLGDDMSQVLLALKDTPQLVRDQMSGELAQLFNGCIDRWGDLNLDPSVPQAKRDRIVGPMQFRVESALVYADVKAQILEIFGHPDIPNSTPIVRKTAEALLAQAKKDGKLSVLDEERLTAWIANETAEPLDEVALKKEQAIKDKARHEALTAAMEMRMQLQRRADQPTTYVNRKIEERTGKTTGQILADLEQHLNPTLRRGK